MQYLHTPSCTQQSYQTGYGMARYRGIPYQEGYGVYQGQVFQRGHGLGGVLGNVFKTAVLPAAKRMGKDMAKRAGQQAIKTGMDVVINKRDVKDAIKSGLKDVAQDTLNNAIKEATHILMTQHCLSTHQARLEPRRRDPGEQRGQDPERSFRAKDRDAAYLTESTWCT